MADPVDIDKLYNGCQNHKKIYRKRSILTNLRKYMCLKVKISPNYNKERECDQFFNDIEVIVV